MGVVTLSVFSSRCFRSMIVRLVKVIWDVGKGPIMLTTYMILNYIVDAFKSIKFQ